MKPTVLVVYLKELLDSVRDRRTLIMVRVASILSGPVILVLLAQWFTSLEEKSQVMKVRIAGQERAPALVNFLQRSDVQIETAPPDYEKLVREGRLDAVIVVPRDFDERFASGDGAQLEIIYDDSRTDARGAYVATDRLLRAFNRETAMLRLMARGVSPDMVQPVKVNHLNTATPRQKGAMLLFLIPMFAIMAPFLGGMTLAIDSTAGERERGSLEPLLANPVATWRVVLGKFLAAWTFACAVAALTLAGFVAAATLYAGKRVAALMTFGMPELGLFIAMVVPFAAMTAGLQMLISTYGRSYREAQTYVSYVATLVSFVPMIVLFSGLKDAFWQLLVPVLGQQVVLMRIVRGEGLSLIDWALPSLVAIAIGAACVHAVAQLLRDERIVFGRA